MFSWENVFITRLTFANFNNHFQRHSNNLKIFKITLQTKKYQKSDDIKIFLVSLPIILVDLKLPMGLRPKFWEKKIAYTFFAYANSKFKFSYFKILLELKWKIIGLFNRRIFSRKKGCNCCNFNVSIIWEKNKIININS